MGRKRKPLLAEQGIVHLKHSFVQPTEESGLLKTVGGEEDRSALILATGSYGYAIPISSLTKDNEEGTSSSSKKDKPTADNPDFIEVVEEISDSEDEGDGDRGKVVKIVRQKLPEKSSSNNSNSEKTSTTNSSGGGSKTNSKQSGSNNDKESEKPVINPDELSVAELVRVIGGGRNAPLRRCDIVDDRRKDGKDAEEAMDHDHGGVDEEDPEADEFYESLGIQRSKKRKLDEDEGDVKSGESRANEASSSDNQVPPDKLVVVEDADMLQSIQDYYKDNVNHLYHYSQQHNPYGSHRLEFGPFIDAEDSSEYDQDYIQLARLAQRARAAAQAAAERRKRQAEKADKGNEEEEIYDPLPMEVVSTTAPEDLGITVDANLEQFWDCVKDDPHDFNRWIYLIQYVEGTDNLNSCRRVYSAFLPLFPYCFGYWKRYAELEKRSYYYGRALAILEKGLEFIPLSVDLWMSYLSLFKEVNAHQPDFEVIVRAKYERALDTCGMEFRSDPLWESFIEWETENKRLKKAFNLYRRLIQVPTRLYNRHWDNVQSLVRDHHPRDFLEYEEYDSMRLKGCKKLGLRYKAEPEVLKVGEIRKTSKPEDKLMDFTKAKILKQLTKTHEKCEEEVNKRWIFEDKIKRPYYHTKPLDKFQLRNWDEYLDFEINEKNHDRIVLLFERCLIACANYEEFWSKYARYVESYHKEHSKDLNVSIHVQKSKINEELVSQKETEREEAIISDVKDCLDGLIDKIISQEEQQKAVRGVIDTVIDNVIFMEESEDFVVNKFATIGVNNFFERLENQVGDHQNGECANGESSRQHPDLRGNLSELPHKSGITDNSIHSETSAARLAKEVASASLLSVPTFPETRFRWQETVRDIYKRACIIHCAKKPVIRLQWAAYEEELGNVDGSRKLVQHVLQWFPNFLDAKLQLLDLERRCGNHKVLEELYEKYIVGAKSPSESSLLANKFARFLFKGRGKPDKALTVLRKAIKKDRSNASLYSYVFDICYERFPTDRKGAAAALELAILSKDISEENKLIFLRRKMLFLQEHGDIRRLRDAVDQLRIAEDKMRRIKLEEQRKKEEEEKEIAFLRSEAFKKFEQIETMEAYPVPELSQAQKSQETSQAQKAVPIDFETNEQALSPVSEEDGPIRAKIVVQGTSISEVVKEGPELPYQKVAPPNQFIVDTCTYGYGSKHPDQKIMEHMAQKEYEKLESKGYPEHMKDTDDDKKFLRQQAKLKHSTKDPTFIVPPSSTYSVVPVGPPPRRRADPPAPGEFELKPPRQLAILPVPSTDPCVNVPDWFIKDGGEMCLSESRLGFSILRYWPHFLTEEGNEKMFRSVRKHVKWHQKQKIIAGHWRYLHRLVSWLGPCDFTHNGMVLQKCEDWPPEILDQLHRINKMVGHEFNACSLDLYRHGHDWNSWHSENLPAYGSNPPVAIVTLGSLRILEMKRKGPEFNYVRFPLFPGSLFLMEGVTQADWAHQITKDPLIKDETLMLIFRIMHAIETPEIEKLIKFVKSSDKNKDGNPEDSEIVVIGPNSKDVKTEIPAEPSSKNDLDDKTGSGTASGSTSSTDNESKSSKKESPRKASAKTKATEENDKKNSTRIVFHKVR